MEGQIFFRILVTRGVERSPHFVYNHGRITYRFLLLSSERGPNGMAVKPLDFALGEHGFNTNRFHATRVLIRPGDVLKSDPKARKFLISGLNMEGMAVQATDFFGPVRYPLRQQKLCCLLWGHRILLNTSTQIEPA